MLLCFYALSLSWVFVSLIYSVGETPLSLPSWSDLPLILSIIYLHLDTLAAPIPYIWQGLSPRPKWNPMNCLQPQFATKVNVSRQWRVITLLSNAVIGFLTVTCSIKLSLWPAWDEIKQLNYFVIGSHVLEGKVILEWKTLTVWQQMTVWMFQTLFGSRDEYIFVAQNTVWCYTFVFFLELSSKPVL